jgi:hypothetical protein
MTLDEIMESDFMKGGIYKIPDFLPNNIRTSCPSLQFIRQFQKKGQFRSV